MTTSTPNTGRRVAAIGMFDGVHLGHRALVRQLCEIGEAEGLIPTVFTFDRHPLELIAPDRAPFVITTPAQRGDLLHVLGVADVFVLAFNKALRALGTEDFMHLLHDQYAVDTLLLGFNHRFGHDSPRTDEEYSEIGAKYGVKVVRSDKTVYNESTHQAISSSAIRTLIGAGDIDMANTLMGHTMALRGLVRHGNAIGRTIGYPTANLEPVIRRQIRPARGVYAGRAVLVDGKVYPTMVNIGYNPTLIHDGEEIRVEAHIIGYSGDLYEKVMDVEIISRLRDEQHFPSVDAMTAQLAIDRENTLRIVANLD